MVLPGFNTDFKYKGQVYHAQTEDNGESNPVVVTLLYLRGAILSSRKTSYGDLLGREGGYQRELMELMKSQHREMMREVLAGKFDAPPGAGAPATVAAAVEETPLPPRPAATSSPGPKSLDEVIMNYLESFAAGRVTIL